MTGSIARIGTDLALFNALDEGVVAVDAAMTIVFVNPAPSGCSGTGPPTCSAPRSTG